MLVRSVWFCLVLNVSGFGFVLFLGLLFVCLFVVSVIVKAHN